MGVADVSTGARTIKEHGVPCKVTLAAACKIGDALGISGATWVLANAGTTGAVVQPRLVAGEAGAIADVITAYETAVIGGLSGGTVGAYVYPGTAGAYTETSNASSDNAITLIGLMLSATDILVFMNNRADDLND